MDCDNRTPHHGRRFLGRGSRGARRWWCRQCWCRCRRRGIHLEKDRKRGFYAEVPAQWCSKGASSPSKRRLRGALIHQSTGGRKPLGSSCTLWPDNQSRVQLARLLAGPAPWSRANPLCAYFHAGCGQTHRLPTSQAPETGPHTEVDGMDIRPSDIMNLDICPP